MLTRPTVALLITVLPAAIYLAFISYRPDAFNTVALLRTLLSLRFLIIFLFILSPKIPISYFDGFGPSLIPAIMLRGSYPYRSRVWRMIRVRWATQFHRIPNKRCKPLLCIKHRLITCGDDLRIGLAGFLRSLADSLSSPSDSNISVEADSRRLTANLQTFIRTIAARDSTIRSLTQLLADMERSMFGMEADRKKEKLQAQASKRNAEIQYLGQILLLETQAVIEKGNHDAEMVKKANKSKARKARLEHATTRLSDQGTQLLEQELQIGRQTSRIRAQNAQILQQEGFLERFWNLDAEFDTKTWELASCRIDLEISTSNIATLTSRVGTLEVLNSTLTSRVSSLEAVVVTKTRAVDAMTQLADQRGADLEETQLALVAQARAVRLEEANVRSKCRMLGRLNAKYDALLDTVLNADVTFNATVKGFEAQIASLKTDLASAVDCRQMMESALEDALAGEEEAWGLVEELEETLRQRVEAEHRVLRNLGIDLDSEEGEDTDESVKDMNDPHSMAEEESPEVEDEAFQGEENVGVAALASSPESSFLMVGNTYQEKIVESSVATPLAADTEEPVEVVAEYGGESLADSPELDAIDTSQLFAAGVNPTQDNAGLGDRAMSEAQGSAPDPPRARVLHTQLWSRRPLGIRKPEWEDLWCGGGQQETQTLTTSTPDAEPLASDVPVEDEAVVAPINLSIIVEAGTDAKVPTEATLIPSQAPGEDFTNPAIIQMGSHDPSVIRFRRMMRDPPRARVLHTPLYSRRPLGTRRPEWVDTVLTDGEQELPEPQATPGVPTIKATSLHLVEGVSQPLPPSQTYPRGILNAKGGLWEAPVNTTSRVTWSHEERMFYFPGDEPEVIACTDSEKHDVA